MSKNIFRVIFTILTIFTVSACSNESSEETLDDTIKEELQSNTWNVVSTNGDAYTADFSDNTVTLDFNIIKSGLSYEIKDSVATLTEEDSDFGPWKFEVSKNNDDFEFKANDESTKDRMGDLTLSPKE